MKNKSTKSFLASKDKSSQSLDIFDSDSLESGKEI